MLKIKENINLKELEKYGFELDKREVQAFYYTKNKYGDECIFGVDIFNRIIVLEMRGDFENFDVLYDLIKDGIVEKV